VKRSQRLLGSGAELQHSFRVLSIFWNQNENFIASDFSCTAVRVSGRTSACK